LDVEMPEESGFQLFEYFKDYNFEVIFTTAHNKYAINAFRYAALDYLLKPVDFRELGIAIERFKVRVKDFNRIKIDTFVNNLSHDMEINKRVLFPTRIGYEVEKVSNILYCRADENYATVITLDKKSYTVTSTLKNLEDTLPENTFFRIHKTYLINMNHVKTYDKKRNKVILEGSIELDVATRRIDDFLKVISKS
jgi:two-component system LytT family response regulator